MYIYISATAELILVKFSKGLLGSKNLNVNKTSASYYAPFFKLTGVTGRPYNGHLAFCSKVLTGQNFQGTFQQNGKDYTQVLYIK